MTHAENPRSARQLIRGGPYALTKQRRWTVRTSYLLCARSSLNRLTNAAAQLSA
ncbi:hypothetical protein GOB43_14980 [Sinorhizobium meliloti]|nr:hypothetical protein [Sinorhizobium meliloti]